VGRGATGGGAGRRGKKKTTGRLPGLGGRKNFQIRRKPGFWAISSTVVSVFFLFFPFPLFVFCSVLGFCWVDWEGGKGVERNSPAKH